MPYRNLNPLIVLMGLGGLLILAGLLLWGIDVRRAARTGPMWKRRLLAAGLMLLGLGGVLTGKSLAADKPTAVMTCYDVQAVPLTRPAPDRITLSPKATPQQQTQWEQVLATWRQAADIADRQDFSYPQTAAQQKQLLADLESAEQNITKLEAAGLVAKPTADLFRTELAGLTQAIGRFRPEPDKGQPEATCYRSMTLVAPAELSLKRLEAQAQALAAAAKDRTILPAVAAQAARIIRRDLDTLKNPLYRKQLKDAEQKQAQELIVRVDGLLAALNAPADGAAEPTFVQTPQWGQIQSLMTTAGQYVKNGSTEAQRNQFDQQLKLAGENLKWLGHKGYLSYAAITLLGEQLQGLKEEVYRKPPTDVVVTCYAPLLILPARESMIRMSKRLPLLKAMLDRQRIQLTVVETLLPQLQADFKTLSDAKQVERLNPVERRRVKEMIPRMQAAMDDLALFLNNADTDGAAVPSATAPAGK